jgi:hypothetical protein
MHAWQAPDSTLTLREGLAAYYRAFPALKRGPGLSPAAQAFFARHDAVHVAWGCDVSLAHEAVVKLASFYGTDGFFSAVRGYLLHDSMDIYRGLDVGEVARTMGRALVIVPVTLWRCLRQKKRWPWAGYEALLDTPLRDLRAAYGIRVAEERWSTAPPALHAA